MQNEGNKLVH